MVEHNLSLEIKKINQYSRTYITVKQNDTGRSIVFDIKSGGENVSIIYGNLRVKRPDGKLFSKAFNGRSVSIDQNMISVPGSCTCDVDISFDDGSVSTDTFFMIVKASPSQNFPEDSEDLSADGVNEGYVLTADGSGGYDWKPAPAGGSGGTGGSIVPERSFTDVNKNSTSKVPSMAAVNDFVLKENANKVNYEDLRYATPEIFGCVGDGVTDDSESMQAAINYCISNGVALNAYGTYAVHGLTVPAGDNRLTINGNGGKDSHPTFINNVENTTLLFVGAGSTLNVDNVTFWSDAEKVSHDFSSVKTDNKYFTVTKTINNVNGLEMNRMGSTLRINNCNFLGFSGFGLKLGQAHRVQNCYFKNCHKAISIYVADETLENCYITCCEYGLYSDASSNIYVNDTWFDLISEHAIYSPNAGTNLHMNKGCSIDHVGKSGININGNLYGEVNGVMSRCGCSMWGQDVKALVEASSDSASAYDIAKNGCNISVRISLKAKVDIDDKLAHIVDGTSITDTSLPTASIYSDGTTARLEISSTLDDYSKVYASRQKGLNITPEIHVKSAIVQRVNTNDYAVNGVVSKSAEPYYGYVGLLWLNTANGNLYICKEATSGYVATWSPVFSVGSDVTLLMSAALVNDTTKDTSYKALNYYSASDVASFGIADGVAGYYIIEYTGCKSSGNVYGVQTITYTNNFRCWKRANHRGTWSATKEVTN